MFFLYNNDFQSIFLFVYYIKCDSVTINLHISSFFFNFFSFFLGGKIKKNLYFIDIKKYNDEFNCILFLYFLLETFAQQKKNRNENVVSLKDAYFESLEYDYIEITIYF